MPLLVDADDNARVATGICRDCGLMDARSGIHADPSSVLPMPVLRQKMRALHG